MLKLNQRKFIVEDCCIFDGQSTEICLYLRDFVDTLYIHCFFFEQIYSLFLFFFEEIKIYSLFSFFDSYIDPIKSCLIFYYFFA
jgi:hypothetical protein